jgi:hypothetical protein
VSILAVIVLAVVALLLLAMLLAGARRASTVRVRHELRERDDRQDFRSHAEASRSRET